MLQLPVEIIEKRLKVEHSCRRPHGFQSSFAGIHLMLQLKTVRRPIKLLSGSICYELKVFW